MIITLKLLWIFKNRFNAIHTTLYTCQHVIRTKSYKHLKPFNHVLACDKSQKKYMSRIIFLKSKLKFGTFEMTCEIVGKSLVS
jgi:hypothetical protein